VSTFIDQMSFTMYLTSRVRSSGQPGGVWLNRGPHGNVPVGNEGVYGFSLAGTHRNVGAVGGAFRAQTNTPFRGVHPMNQGRGPPSYISMNVGPSITQTSGSQARFVKPSVLDSRGAMRAKIKQQGTPTVKQNGTFDTSLAAELNRRLSERGCPVYR
jgi:hypothetical protein